MPEHETLRRAAKAKHEGKAPSTQAGEFVRGNLHHIGAGKRGARSAKQAIGVSETCRTSVAFKPRKNDSATRWATKRNFKKGRRREISSRPSRALLECATARRKFLRLVNCALPTVQTECTQSRSRQFKTFIPEAVYSWTLSAWKQLQNGTGLAEVQEFSIP